MKTILSYPLALALLLLALPALSQTKPGSLRGRVFDQKTKETVPFADIVLKSPQGIVVNGASTNLEGQYEIKALSPGLYRVEVRFVGYAKLVVDSLQINAKQSKVQDFYLRESSEILQEVVIHYQAPLIDKTKSSRISHSVRQNGAPRDISSVAAQAAGVSQNAQGLPNLRGAGHQGEVYYIDGIKVRGSLQIPQAAMEQTAMESSGTPAYVPSQEIALRPENEEAALPAEAPFRYEYRRANQTWHRIPAPAEEASPPFAGENYKHIPENEFLGSYYQPLSTFGADVDGAAYANVRRMLKEGSWPHPDAVRLEEMINYFSYDFPKGISDGPFELLVDRRPCDWNPQHELLRIGLRTEKPVLEELPPSNLVFLIDVSGSMNSPNKLPLLKNALRILVKNLQAEDRVAIVVYASASGVVLESTRASDAQKILEAIDQLSASGSTAGGAGIQLAYKTAREHFDPQFNNRVILATDGDFNVGISSEEGLIELIEKEREAGIFLSVLGFGRGNYQDAKMEQLANHGNGNYAYIDGLMEARKVLAEEMGANLHLVAKDTKFQIEFNPKKVSAYRLIGYENRLLAAKDFDDDRKDAGDIGAGHQVTAVYELIPRLAGDTALHSGEPPLRYQDQSLKEAAYGEEWAQLKIRYKEPLAQESILSIHALQPLRSQDPDFAFLSAVIQYGLVLRRSEFAGSASLEKAIALAQEHLGPDPHGYRREFVGLCKLAKDLAP